MDWMPSGADCAVPCLCCLTVPLLCASYVHSSTRTGEKLCKPDVLKLKFFFLFSTCYGPTIEVALCSEFELVAKVRTRNNS